MNKNVPLYTVRFTNTKMLNNHNEIQPPHTDTYSRPRTRAHTLARAHTTTARETSS